jgi:CheY-like chemotaxis protein
MARALSIGRVHFLRITILLVEDSRFLRVASERALVKAGYDVVSAADGEAALSTARERVPNLILLDMMLPKLDGLGVLRALKRDPQTANIPVIVLTGLGQKNEAKLKKEGAVAYFTKSDSLLEDNSATLLHVVESVVGKQETEAPVAEASTLLNLAANTGCTVTRLPKSSDENSTC